MVRAKAGVKLERVEQADKNEVSFWLTTHRLQSARLIFNETEANRAYALEVEAFLKDPVILNLMKTGHLES
ncbi:hypothetical protein [Brevundimonas faecalis]|uniref:hypothetical protein n=1 Tax=Brevundimonas faecalis TaxID=947378 RepID=UPI003394E74E